jgi:CRP-like cAMP-binding protein
LLSDLERTCREKWDCLIEVDVSAYAPRMQRTLIELGFLPVAYLPALVFHEVERLDVVKMVRLLSPPRVGAEGLTPACTALAELVLRLFRNRTVLPRIARAVHDLPLYAGLNSEQVARLAGVCGITTFEPGQTIFHEGVADNQMHVVLEGEVAITLASSAAPVGVVRSGECLGEMSLLTGAVHSATATAVTRVETAVLGHEALAELIRRRPDIGLHIYRNLAVGIGQKLKRRGVSPTER